MGDRWQPKSGALTLLAIALTLLTLLPNAHCSEHTAGQDASSSGLLQRVKRGWVWNQFFVLEEYTGLEPLYIGKVSSLQGRVRGNRR